MVAGSSESLTQQNLPNAFKIFPLSMLPSHMLSTCTKTLSSAMRGDPLAPQPQLLGKSSVLWMCSSSTREEMVKEKQ